MARTYLQDIKREKKVHKGILKADTGYQRIRVDQLPSKSPREKGKRGKPTSEKEVADTSSGL